MRILLQITLLALIFTACGKWIVGNNPRNSPRNNYDFFYQTVKENYSFFPEKEVDWDALDRIYRPLVNDSISNDSLYAILSKMLHALKDGHVNLYVGHDRSRNADWYLDYPANFNPGFLNRNYWGTDYQSTGPLLNAWLDSIGYIYYGRFSSTISKSNLDHVLNRFADAKGLIIDVRENGGGSMGNVWRLVERFVDTTMVMGTMDYKTGPNDSQFSSQDTFIIKPKVDYRARAEAEAKRKKKKKNKEEEEDTDKKEDIRGPGTWAVADSTAMFLNKPIVVLINRHSYSATNFFSAFMSNLPNVTLIGDRSGGGGGIPVSFELPNGWKFRLSATRTFLPDGTNIESGIEPDIYQNTGPAEELQGVDAIIERAKTFILESDSN
jgi:hypothetical protein